MKKKSILVLLVMMLLVLNPIKTFASEMTDDYKTLNFVQTLEDEGIEKAFDNYKETDDQITIYLFRGKECGFCRAFLTYMNSITEEYGKYFKMVTFEVWKDQKNSKLMQEISYFLKQPAGGVPYIIIGDTVFAGFSEEMYGEGIKQAIVNLYNTDKDERYDVFEEYEKSKEGSTKVVSDSSLKYWVVGSVIVATAVIILFVNYKFNTLNNQIDIMVNDMVTQMKKPTNPEREVNHETSRPVKRRKRQE